MAPPTTQTPEETDMPNLPRPILVGALAGLLLAGCAEHPTTRATGTTGTSAVTPAPASRARHQNTSGTSSAGSDQAESTGETGIPACDDYLSSYLACHRAADIYAPDQLQSRYEAMRSSLLRDSRNPSIRPQLAARCNSLSSQLRQALDGKSCAEHPAAATSTP
jgi:hypothetical protein